MAEGAGRDSNRVMSHATRARKRYRVLRESGYVLLLFGGSLWLIVHSPIAKTATFADSVGTLVAAVTLCLILLACAAILVSLFWREERRQYARQTITAMGFSALVFGMSFWLVTNSSIEKPVFGADWGGVVLTAATLALFVFSTLIALVALVGWPNLDKFIMRKIHEVVDPTLNTIQRELRGRSSCTAGYALGELSLGKGKESIRVERRELLEAAVDSCFTGFRELEGAGDGPRLMALNNWLYYSTLLKDPLPLLTDSEALEYARELEKVGRRVRATRLQLTYCRVVARRIGDHEERMRAKTLLHSITKQLSPYESIEAQDCLKLLEINDPKLTYRG